MHCVFGQLVKTDWPKWLSDIHLTPKMLCLCSKVLMLLLFTLSVPINTLHGSALHAHTPHTLQTKRPEMVHNHLEKRKQKFWEQIQTAKVNSIQESNKHEKLKRRFFWFCPNWGSPVTWGIRETESQKSFSHLFSSSQGDDCGESVGGLLDAENKLLQCLRVLGVVEHPLNNLQSFTKWLPGLDRSATAEAVQLDLNLFQDDNSVTPPTLLAHWTCLLGGSPLCVSHWQCPLPENMWLGDPWVSL